MSRGRKLKKKESRRREVEKKEHNKSDLEDKTSNEKIFSPSSLFKCDEIIEIISTLGIQELDEGNAVLGAVVLGRFNIVKKLLREGHSINKCAQEGICPLLWAIKLKLIVMADFLIKRGADVNTTDQEGNNVFLLALQTPSWDQDTFMDFWTKIKDTDVNMSHANKLGNNVLHYIVKRQWDSALEMVASTTNINLNTVTGKGVTALMMACSRHQEACIATLLKYKADIWIEDNRGCTALCYAIAYFIQKRLEMPNQQMDLLLSALEKSPSKHNLNAYIKRRFDLMYDPPETNFGNTVLSIIIHVITFATRCLNTGIETFLKIRIFKLIKEITEKHMDDGEYILTVLTVMAEALRFCDCCMDHLPKNALFACFYESGIPNMCLRILKKFGASTFPSCHIHTVLMPLFYTCKHPSAKPWMRKNFKMLLYYYKNSTHLPPTYMSLYPNDTHLILARQTHRDFKNILTEIQNTDVIFDAKANKKDLKDQEDNFNKAMDAIKKETEKRKMSQENKPGVNVEKTEQSKNENNDSYWSSSSELFTDSFSTEFGGETVSTPTIYPNWQEEFKEGCDLFGITENSVDIEPPEIKVEEGSGDMGDTQEPTATEYEPMVKELDVMFNEIIIKYEQVWQKEYDEGYVDANGDTDDYLKLMHVLPGLEHYYLSEVTKKWKNLVDQLKINYNDKKESCKNTIEEIKDHLEKLFKEINQRYVSVMLKPAIKEEVNEECEKSEGTPFESLSEASSSTDESNKDSDSDEETLTCSEEEWLRTDSLLAEATETDAETKETPIPSPGSSKNSELICSNCRSLKEPFFMRTMYAQILNSLKQIWQKCVRSGQIEDIVLPPVQEDSKVTDGGSFGPMYIGLDLCSMIPLVVKKVRKDNIFDQLVADALKTTVKMLINLHSDFILPYTHCIEIKNELVLATPLCEKNLGEHLTDLKRTERFNLSVARMMIKQVIEGIHFLHSQETPIVHGNLKPSNILIDRHGRLRLSEFGIGTVLYQRCPPQVSAVIWWAQETYWHYRNYFKLLVGPHSDIQVCGMVIHYIATGGIHPLGHFPNEIMFNLEHAKLCLRVEQEEVRDLIGWMLIHKITERPKISMVLRHVFLWDRDTRWRFLLTCAGVSPDSKRLSFSVLRFHESLDAFAKDNNVNSKWVQMVARRLVGLVPAKVEYKDTISGILKLLKDTFPKSSSWFLSVFPSLPLTLYRLMENSSWIKHKDFAEFVNLEY